MGNTIIKSNNNNLINDTILGKKVQQILREDTAVFDKNNPVKINKIRACCLGVAKKNPIDTDFVTVNLPIGLTKAGDSTCKRYGKCIGTQKLGLQFKNVTCDENFKTTIDSKGTYIGTPSCDAFMVNKCAKELYDQGCIKVVKGKNNINKRIWDTTNANCIDPTTKTSIYGSEDCACINSLFAGYTLNNDPSKSIKGGLAFETNDQNPYGIDGSTSNLYTKYSLDVMGQGPSVQYPQLFDPTCAARSGVSSVASGMSKPYLLPKYRKNPTVCMNKIQIKDSNIGTLNMKNIKQSNTCNQKSLKGKKPIVEVTGKSRPVAVNSANKVGMQENKIKHANAIEKANAIDEAKKKVLAETESKHKAALAETESKHKAAVAKSKRKTAVAKAALAKAVATKAAATKAAATAAETVLAETKSKHKETYTKILLIALCVIIFVILIMVLLPSDSDNKNDDSSGDN